MTLVFVVLGIAVVAGAAVLIARDRPLIDDDPVGTRPLHWPSGTSVGPRDIDEVRFTIALRGYRMEEVDRVLDDTRRALAQRDAQIADVQQELARLRTAAGDGESSVERPALAGTEEDES